jgi:hypothetical protein
MDGGSHFTVTEASPHEMLTLADAYAASADQLLEQYGAGKRDLRLPAHLCAMHAVELYLHAFLRFRGATSKDIKSRQHNFEHEEFCERLGLDQKTREHLKRLSDRNEYLLVRYRPERVGDLSQANRMQRTLKAVHDARDRIPFVV